MTRRHVLALAALCFLLLIISTASAEVGRTQGGFEVTTSGSSRYTIPIWTPPGSGGLRPELAIDYHDGRDNGILGMGFAITGLSVISRCPKTIAQDGSPAPITLSSSDVYCLDGERLRRTSGTYGLNGSTYQTEVDRVIKVIAFDGNAANGPDYFEAWHKDGLIYEYGKSDIASEDARIQAWDGSRVHSWALNAVRDRSGNRMEFKYLEDITNGVARPDEIVYATNAGTWPAPYMVKFEYEAAPRPDTVEEFHPFGGLARETKRLDRIEIKHNQSTSQGSPDYVVKRIYKFSYQSGAGGRSRLQSVQECSTTTNPADCLSPTTFQWTNATAAFQSEQTLPSGIPSDVHLVDIDADGRDDLVYVSSPSGGGTWRIRKALAAGGYGSETNTNISNENYTAALPADWDGDGKADLVVPRGSPVKWHVLKSDGTTLVLQTPGIVTAVSPYGNTRAYDLNGDSREDLVRASSTGEAKLYVQYRSGSGFASEVILWQSFDPNITFYQWAAGPLSPVGYRYRSAVRRADFDGDGKEDFIGWLSIYDPESQQSQVYVTRFQNGAPTGALEAGGDLGGNHLYGDLNDDGLTDIVWIRVANDLRIVYGGSTDVVAGPSASSHYNATYVVADYDADGRQDVLAQRLSNGAFEYFRSTGTNLAAPATTGLSHALYATFRVGNVNGDLHADFISIAGSTIKYSTHQPTPADLLTKATDGFKTSVEFEYLPMTDSAVYTKGTGTTYPNRDVTYARPLVRRAKVPDGSGAEATFNLDFTYEAARHNQWGRNFLGFAKRKLTDTRTGIYTEETFSQDSANYAWIGMPSSKKVFQSDNTKIREESYTWGQQTLSSGFDERRLPYVSSSVRDDYEVAGTQNGIRFRSTTTTNVVDQYGTLTSSTETASEIASGAPVASFTTQVTLTGGAFLISNDTPWCLGRPKQTLIARSHTRTDGGSITRRIDRVWDETKCRVTQETIEPLASNWLRTTFEYDDDPGVAAVNFGNVTKETVTSSLAPDRITQVEWDTSGRFPFKVTKAVGHVTERTWNNALALKLSEKEPNGVTTTFESDAFGRPKKITYADTTHDTLELSECNLGNNYCGTNDRARYQVRTTKRKSNEDVLAEQFGVFDSYDRALRARSLMLGTSYSLVDSTFDIHGRLATESAPYYSGSPTYLKTYTYDIVNRLRLISHPANDDPSPPTAVTETFYEGLLQRVVDAEGKQTRFVRDGIGQMLSVARAFGTGDVSSSSYTYNAFGDLKSVVGPGSATISHTYDTRGFRTQTTDPNLGQLTFEYLPTGELKRMRDAKTTCRRGRRNLDTTRSGE